jgi:uncharacterized protein
VDEYMGRFNILVLSGGGYRGLYTAKVLADIERETKKPIREQFDLISGTSIGGILALAIAKGVPAQDMVNLFINHGDAIFKSRNFTFFGLIFKSPFTQDVLAHHLDCIFGNATLGDLQSRVLIPAINYSTGEPQLFKTPHHESFRHDHRLKIKDIALATSAAPTYFPRHKIENSQFVDGGLFANFPGYLALHEAEHFLKIPLEDIHLLAVGTMSSRYTVDPSQNLNGGLLDWGRAKHKWQLIKALQAPESILQLGISVQESLCGHILKQKLLGRFTMIDSCQNEYSSSAVGLSKTDTFADDVLLANATSDAKRYVGMQEFKDLQTYTAKNPQFFHGPHAINSSEVLQDA